MAHMVKVLAYHSDYIEDCYRGYMRLLSGILGVYVIAHMSKQNKETRFLARSYFGLQIPNAGKTLNPI